MTNRSKQRLDWETIDKAILEAIRQIEYKNPFNPVTVSQIQEELKNQERSPPRRSIYNHLNGLKPYGPKSRLGLIDRELVIKIGRGLYSSKMAMIAKKLAQEVIFREVYEFVPRLEGDKFNKFLSRHLSITNELKRDLEKKRKIPIIGLYFACQLKKVQANERLVKPIIRDWIQKDFDYIQDATEIIFLLSKKLPSLNTYKIRETVMDVLYYTVERERKVAEAKGEKFSLENFGLNIFVSFNPKKSGEPPRKPTFQESIAKIEDMPPSLAKAMGYDDEKIKRLKRIDQKEKEYLLQWEYGN